MNVSPQSALALQRHYLGALRTPARTWIEALPPARLAFAGSAIRRTPGGGCALDFGIVDAALHERRTVRVFQPGGRPAAIRIDDFASWLAVEWLDGESGSLVVQVRDDGEGERSGEIAFRVRDELGARRESLPVRITVRPRHPLAEIAFHGSHAADPLRFVEMGDTCTIAVANRTSVPLVVTFAELPAWLEFSVDGCSRRGPEAGAFFERIAPFTVTLRPRFIGRYEGSLRMRTNDPRPELRDVELRLSASVAPLRPHVRVPAPPPIVGSPAKTLATHVRIENWGRSAARIACKANTPSLTAGPIPPVPALQDGQPGTAVLPVRIAASQLAAGTHQLGLELHIEDGNPSACRVPIQVVIRASAKRRRELRPETIAALLALLLLTVVLLVAARGLS